MKRVLVIILLITLIIGGILAANIRREQKSDWVDMNIETQLRQGSLYAAARFLEEYGHSDVNNQLILYGFNNKSIQHAHNSLLIINSTDSELTRDDAHTLLSWVQRGNTAVIGLDQYSPFRSHLLEQLDIRITEKHHTDDEKESSLPIAPSCQRHEQYREQQLRRTKTTFNTSNSQAHLQHCSSHINTIRLPEGRTLSIYSDSQAQIQIRNQDNSDKIWFTSRNPNGAHGTLLGLHHGHGRIIIAAELDFFHNPRHPDNHNHTLTSHDHAYFLAYLAQSHDSVHLIGTWKPLRDLLPPPTWLKLWRSQPIAIILFLTTIIIGAWHIASRTGTIRQLPPAPERSLNRHLLAQGRFFSQHFSQRAILQHLQQELLEEWQARHPAWKNMNSEQRLQLLSRHTQLPPSQLKTWLTPLPEQISHTQWLQMLQSHRLIRRHNRRNP